MGHKRPEIPVVPPNIVKENRRKRRRPQKIAPYTELFCPTDYANGYGFFHDPHLSAKYVVYIHLWLCRARCSAVIFFLFSDFLAAQSDKKPSLHRFAGFHLSYPVKDSSASLATKKLEEPLKWLNLVPFRSDFSCWLRVRSIVIAGWHRRRWRAPCHFSRQSHA
jgi:hypothetical protein